MSFLSTDQFNKQKKEDKIIGDYICVCIIWDEEKGYIVPCKLAYL